MAEKNLGDLKAKFKVDVDQVTKLVKGVSDMRKDFATMETQLKKVNEQLNIVFTNLNKIKGVGGLSGGIGGGTTPAGGWPLPLGDPKAQPSSVTQNQTVNLPAQELLYSDPPGGRGGGGVPLARMSRMGPGITMAGQAVAAAIEIMNRRMDSNYERSLGADKLGVFYQQNKGISQQNYVDNMRLPLANQRLGYGGISTMLALQASTGLKADLNASGFAAQRALSGYSIGTDQLAQQAATLAGPAANNRMTMMLGTGMYGLGGKQRSSMQVMQDVVQRTGLTDPNRLKGARQLGSNTRAMLLASGVPEDMVDQYLDYAEANNNFQKKTGSKSMYDPSTLKDRKVMGIEDNFSTQAEETARTKEQRDENFYNRQKDNLPQFEKNIQSVTEALGYLEDRLSTLVGGNISTRGGMGRKIAGGAMMAGGAALAFFGAPTGIAPVAGAALIASGAAMLGDPVKSTKSPAGKGGSILYGYSKPAERKSIGEVQNTAGFRNLNSTFRDRLLRMFEANPAVGLGSGHRSEADQERLFLSRYSEVTDGSKGDATYKGKQYKRHSGATVAPPGRSMHEVGLAADLVGDLDWVAKHAKEFGLKTIDGLNEPWHIQPAELPDSRYEWEKQGSKFGHPPGTSKGEVGTDSSSGGPEGTNVVGDKIINGSSLAGAIETFNQTSIASIVGAGAQYDAMDGGGTSSVVSKAALNESPSSTPTSKGSGVSGTMDPVEMAQIMLRRKFPKEAIAKMLAISYRESRWQPGARKNDDIEDSFGLFQINMKGNLGPVRRGHYGLSSNEELFDPLMNIKAARILFGDGQGIKHWGIDGDPMHNTAEGMPKAIAAAQAVGIDSIGDPTFSEPTRGGGNVTVGGATTVTIAPNIYITSSGSTASDAQQMALELARLLDNNLKRELLRSV